jgi:hypothetical protein
MRPKLPRCAGERYAFPHASQQPPQLTPRPRSAPNPAEMALLLQSTTVDLCPSSGASRRWPTEAHEARWIARSISCLTQPDLRCAGVLRRPPLLCCLLCRAGEDMHLARFPRSPSRAAAAFFGFMGVSAALVFASESAVVERRRFVGLYGPPARTNARGSTTRRDCSVKPPTPRPRLSFLRADLGAAYGTAKAGGA